MFPWLGKWFSSIKVVKNTVQSQEQIRKMTKRLKDTLVPQVCRGFVDAFLIRQQTLEVCRLVLQLFSKIVNVFMIYNVFNKNTTVSFCVSSFHGTNIFYPFFSICRNLEVTLTTPVRTLTYLSPICLMLVLIQLQQH